MAFAVPTRVRLSAITTMPVVDVTTCLVVDESSISVSVALLMNGVPGWSVWSAAPRNSYASEPLSGALLR